MWWWISYSFAGVFHFVVVTNKGKNEQEADESARCSLGESFDKDPRFSTLRRQHVTIEDMEADGGIVPAEHGDPPANVADRMLGKAEADQLAKIWMKDRGRLATPEETRASFLRSTYGPPKSEVDGRATETYEEFIRRHPSGRQA